MMLMMTDRSVTNAGLTWVKQATSIFTINSLAEAWSKQVDTRAGVKE